MYISDLKHPTHTLEEKLHALFRLNARRGVELSFRPPFLNLLKAFGNPHLSLPPVIHVAGTNGKGSIMAMLRSILEAGGYKVHAYTSPHLVKFNERIVLGGAPIDDTALEALIDEALTLNHGDQISFFEITTAMAFAAFARNPADICLVEVGLGGRLDCTNVIPRPLLTIINTIGLDHTELLGGALLEIATEKAGIMKTHTPCVIGVQSASAVEAGVEGVFEECAKRLGTPLFRYGPDWVIDPQMRHGVVQMRFKYGSSGEIYYPLPALIGAHQVNNAGAVLAALRVIAKDFPVPDSAIETGLRQVHWPARLQQLDPVIYGLPETWELWLDGGHNAEAAQAISAQAAHWARGDNRPLHMIVGMLAHKDPDQFLEPLIPYAQSLNVVGIEGEPKALTAQDLQAAFPMARSYGDFKAALESLKTQDAPRARVLICGSLYLAGAVLAAGEA